MSSWNFSYSSSSFMSWSTTSTSSGGNGNNNNNNNNNRQTRGQAYMREAHSNPSGSATRTTTQTLGQQPIQETRYYDARGRERLPYHANSQQRQPAAIAQGHVEEIPDDHDDYVDDDQFRREEEARAADKAYKKRVTQGGS